MGLAWDRYDNDTYFWSARLFGYLGRVCPVLEDLSLSVGYQVWPLMKGLCLLTRLNKLQRLELRTFGTNSSDQEPFQREDFTWIQGCTRQRSGPPTSFSSLSSSISSLKSLLWQGSRPRPEEEEEEEGKASEWTFAFKDYQYCLNKMRTQIIHHRNTGRPLYDPFDVESDRSRVRQTQRLNDYRTVLQGTGDALPMVDGLRDFAIYRTWLDIRAFHLQESLHLIQEQQQQQQHQQQQQGILERSAKDIARASQPWPDMEQFLFTHEYVSLEPIGRQYHRNLGRALGFLKELRPDIDFRHESFVRNY